MTYPLQVRFGDVDTVNVNKILPVYLTSSLSLWVRVVRPWSDPRHVAYTLWSNTSRAIVSSFLATTPLAASQAAERGHSSSAARERANKIDPRNTQVTLTKSVLKRCRCGPKDRSAQRCGMYWHVSSEESTC